MTRREVHDLVLPRSLDLSAAEPLCAELRARLLSGEPIVLDAGQIERVSTSCLQILISAAKSAGARGLSFQLREPSDALNEALAVLGLANSFPAREA